MPIWVCSATSMTKGATVASDLLLPSTADRIRLITQVITGIRVVKLLHWEPPYVPSHTALSVPCCDFAHFPERFIHTEPIIWEAVCPCDIVRVSDGSTAVHPCLTTLHA